MRLAFSILAGAVAAGAAALLLDGGCGLITAPVTVPMAVASNANFTFNFTPVDMAGNPTGGVVLSQELRHDFWEPLVGSTETDEHHLRKIDGNDTVRERGRQLNLIFMRDGYMNAEYHLYAADAKTLNTPDGDWTNAKNFPVVMIPASPEDQRLAVWQETIDYSGYPKERVVDLARLRRRSDPAYNGNAEDPASLRPGTFYLTLVKQPPRTIDAKGDIDPSELNMPARIALRIAGPDAGFVRIEPKLGFAPLRTADAAPTSGYTEDLVIEEPRLREMRSAGSRRIIEGHEYFYFRADGHYGKGYIMWQENAGTGVPQPLSLSFGFWVQPNDGDTNLTSHHMSYR